jgi:hypothetical protein
MCVRFEILAIAACGLAAASAHAQRVPFFAPAGTGFDPEISVVNSGQVLDAQVAVSHDRKYVTINTRAASSRLLALRDFSFANGGNNPRLGFVGGAGGLLLGGRGNDTPNALDRRGMTLVGHLED